MYQSCCNGFIGGTIRKPVCFFRWDGSEYLGAFGDTPSLPPPSPDGKTISTGAIVAVVVSVVIFVVLLALVLVIRKRRQSYKTLKPKSEFFFLS